MSAPHKEPMAFPMQYADDSYQQGMTLRDYFAAKALSGLLADPTPFEDHGKGIKAAYATSAYEYADAMLEARQK